MLSSTKKERRRKLSRTLLSGGIKIPTDQYHFTNLQTARQVRNETPQEFADRCRSLAPKVMGKSDESRIQRVHRENADRMLLASFISGLSGNSGRQVTFANPQDMEHALRIVFTVQDAERQERFNESFYSQFEESYASAHGPQVEHPRKASVSDSQLTRLREVTRALNVTIHRAAPAGHRPPAREKRKYGTSCVATNVMA